MKGLFTLLTLTILVLPALGQLTPAQQKQLDDARKKLEQLQKDPAIQAKMQRAQQAMNNVKADTSVQRKVDQAGTQLKGVQQDHPEAAGIQMPGMGNMNVPNLDSINQQLNKGTQMMSSYMGALNQTMPKQNPMLHAEKLPALTTATIKTLAQGILKQVLPKIDPFKKTLLKTRFDSCRNLAGLGAFLLANGASTNETMYIICNAILKNPADIWSVNNLGVYFRDLLQYEPALQCYFYANSLDSGRSTVLDVNIAWASSYYGDFDAAGKYFSKALAIDEYFLSALEGQALMAYQRGDLGALFKCMTKEVEVMMRNVKGFKLGPRGSKQEQAPEPSDEFADMTASAYIRSVGNLEEQSDPTEDHSLDNLADDEPDQGTPPGADEEDVTYPEYRPIFVGKAEDLRRAQTTCVKFMQGSQSILTTLHKNLTAQLSGLKPLVATTETDGKGTLTVDKSYRRYVDLIAEARRLFDRRVYWFVKQYLKDFAPYPMQMFNRAQDMQKAYLEELKGCPVDDPAHTACVNRVNCEWIPKMTTTCNSDIESVTRIWNKYWGSIHSTIQWYIDVTGPLISRIHDVGWNGYVNQERIVDVRTAVLQSYNNWASAVMRIPVPILIGVPIPSCRIDINGMDPPDPFSQKPKKIHEFQGPCYDHDYPMGVGGIQETCHSTKYYIGIGDNKLFWETVKDPLYAQDNNYQNKVGGTVGVSKLLGVEEEDKGSGLKFAAGINVKAEGSIWGQWDANGQFTGAGSSVDASAEASAEISKGNIKVGGSQSVGVDATSTYKVVAGQLQTGPPVISVTH